MWRRWLCYLLAVCALSYPFLGHAQTRQKTICTIAVSPLGSLAEEVRLRCKDSPKLFLEIDQKNQKELTIRISSPVQVRVDPTQLKQSLFLDDIFHNVEQTSTTVHLKGQLPYISRSFRQEKDTVGLTMVIQDRSPLSSLRASYGEKIQPAEQLVSQNGVSIKLLVTEDDTSKLLLGVSGLASEQVQDFLLTDPPRLVLDLERTSLQPTSSTTKSPLLKGVRIGTHLDRSRVVLDLAQPGIRVERHADNTGTQFTVLFKNNQENTNKRFGTPLDSGAPAGEAVAKPPTDAEQQPADFVLSEDGESSTMLFDLYLGDTLKGHILADFTENWCRIQKPSDLVEQLGEISNPSAIESLATGVIHGRKEVADIGSLTCNVETFRVIVQLDQKQLQTKQLRLTGFLPDPPDELAVRSDVRTAFSREVDGSENGSLNLRSTTSLGRSWFTFDGTSIKDQDLEVNDLSLTSAGAISGHSISGGLLRTDGFPFAGSIDFVGTTIRTADEILMDPDVVRGSRLEIFVPSRSRVEFYRGSRLLSVQLLDFGLQEIDTAAFPQGSYFVDIIIRQLNGQVTREQQFFTKSGLLTRVDQPAFTLQVGSARDGLDFEPSPVYQAGMRWRALSFLEIESSFAGNDSLGIGYLDFFGLYDSVTFGAGVSRSTDGGTGVNTNFSGSLLGLNFGGFYTESLATLEKDEDSGALTPFDPVTPSRTTGPSLLNQLDQGRRNLSSFISKRIDDAELRFSLNVNEREDANRRVTYGPIFQWNLINSAENNLRFEVSHLYSTEGENTTGLLYFLHRLDRWGFSHQITGREKDSRFLSSVNYDGRQTSGRGTQFRGANEIASRDDITTSNIVDLQNTSRYAQSRFFLNDQRGADESGTSVGANLDMSATVDESGKVSVANAVNQESLFIATVEGNGATAPVELVVNGTVYDLLEPGNELFIGLTPYRSYRVSIRPLEGSELVGYESDVIEFTLFPGNIIRKTWKLEKIFIGLGKVIDGSGHPLSSVRIRGLKEYVATGEDGSFQAEMTGSEKLTVEDSRGNCQIALPQVSQVEYFYDFGTLTCSASTEDSKK